MARKPRVELEGGLYHVIVRGNARQDIFHSREDHLKFISLLEKAKHKVGFFLYAYCLMTNHLHLLIERRSETVGRIMQRVLTGYSQYYITTSGITKLAIYFKAGTRRSSAKAIHISQNWFGTFI